MCNITVRHNTRKILMIRSLLIGIVAGMRKPMGTVLGATAAVGAAYVSFRMRQCAIRNSGQTSTGLIEDAVAVGSALLVACSKRRGNLGPRSHQVRTAERVGALPFLRGAHRSFQLSVR